MLQRCTPDGTPLEPYTDEEQAHWQGVLNDLGSTDVAPGHVVLDLPNKEGHEIHFLVTEVEQWEFDPSQPRAGGKWVSKGGASKAHTSRVARHSEIHRAVEVHVVPQIDAPIDHHGSFSHFKDRLEQHIVLSHVLGHAPEGRRSVEDPNAARRLFQHHDRVAEEMGVHMEAGPIERHDVLGSYDTTDKSLIIDPSKAHDPEQLIATTAHELAHAHRDQLGKLDFLHHLKTNAPGYDRNISREEVIAEAASHLALHANGIDTDGESFDYIMRHMRVLGISPDELPKEDIMRAANAVSPRSVRQMADMVLQALLQKDPAITAMVKNMAESDDEIAHNFLDLIAMGARTPSHTKTAASGSYVPV